MTTCATKLEDPLEYLPCSTIVVYRRGESIYAPDRPSHHLYLVIGGKVKVSRFDEYGHQTLVDILQADEFFGESAFLHGHVDTEQAMALEPVQLMTWNVDTLQEVMLKRPGLGLALVQMLADRTQEAKARIESLAFHSMRERLEFALLRFGRRFGTVGDDGWLTMMAMPHELIAQYMGTSREIVTQYMIQLRGEGHLTYTRKNIRVAPSLSVSSGRRALETNGCALETFAARAAAAL